MADCELLKRTRSLAKEMGLPTSQVICEFMRVCDGSSCPKTSSLETLEAQEGIRDIQLPPTRTQRFMERLEVAQMGRRPLQPTR